MNGQRGFSLIELTIASAIGTVVLLGVFSLYLATTTSFSQSSSQGYLQRQGTLTTDAIARRVRGASAIARSCTPSAPGGTTGRVLELTLSSPPNPLSEAGAYCYYAGNGGNGVAAGVFCERFTPTVGGAGPCRNLLAGPQSSLVRQTGQAGITLIQQTTPVDPRCPRNTRDATGAPVSLGEVIAAGQYCLGLSVGPPPPVTPADTNADIAFGITDGLDGMTFSVSLTRRN